ncbi:hypothetical protein VTP01DRAFT_3528 [Rhizomucor pusillus]|uniref:uncharacterized protein n=1 Tax=Rhizomucor pusillus TaxID=4840 RepID=UPI003742D7E0
MFKVNDTFPVTPSTVKTQMTSKTYRRAATSFVSLPILLNSIANHALRRSFILQLVSQFSYHIARLSTTYNFFSRVLASSKRSITGDNVVVPRHSFFDVYDGAIWNSIPDPDDLEVSFVRHRRSILFTVNVDWFRPFRNPQYSCGAAYLTINNLPRSQRFKTNNIILVGVNQAQKNQKRGR